MSFTYLASAKRALSLSMPVREEPYSNKACEAFFGGLLPESSEAKKIIGQLFGVSPNNNYNLLEAIGYDCAGAVSIQGSNDPIAPSDTKEITGDPLSSNELAKYLKELPKRPLLAHLGEVRISLAGAQDKAALCMIDGVLSMPTAGSPTTHILKPPISHAEISDSVSNEYFCLRLAKAVGILAVKAEVRTAEDVLYLLVERYDRTKLNNHTVKRVHQEDFCQALGISSLHKYQADGGPTFKKCFDLLDRTTFPAISRKQFIDLVIFNYLIGNADAHAKNFSVLHQEDGVIKLAPAYDLLCTRIYKQTTSRMSMSIGKERDFDSVRKNNWEKFCTENKISFGGFEKTCKEIASKIVKIGERELEALVEEGISTEIPKLILQYIGTSSAALLSQFRPLAGGMTNRLQFDLAMQALINGLTTKLQTAVEQDSSLKVDGQLGTSQGQIVYGDYVCAYKYFPTNQLDIQIGKNGQVGGTTPALTLNGDMVNNQWVDKFDQRQMYSQAQLVETMIKRLKAACTRE